MAGASPVRAQVWPGVSPVSTFRNATKRRCSAGPKLLQATRTFRVSFSMMRFCFRSSRRICSTSPCVSRFLRCDCRAHDSVITFLCECVFVHARMCGRGRPSPGADVGRIEQAVGPARPEPKCGPAASTLQRTEHCAKRGEKVGNSCAEHAERTCHICYKAVILHL